MRPAVALFVVLGLNAVYASERYPENAEVCGDGENEMNCRQDLAGGCECRDTTKCVKEGIRCSDDDVALRAGNSCEGWPGYNGGYPLSKLNWDSENENYECATLASTTDEYCKKWLTLENGDDEWEAGECICGEAKTSMGRQYCHKWSCEQIEVDKCHGHTRIRPSSSRYSTSYNWGNWGWRDTQAYRQTGWFATKFPGYTAQQSGDWDYFPYQCWCRRSDYGYYVCGPEVEQERADCLCKEAKNGNCVLWTCEEYDDAGYHDREYETYTAIQQDTNGIVTEWTGDIDSKSEFEFSECRCTVSADNLKFCLRWACYEKGMNYFYPNLLWSMLHVPINFVIMFIGFMFAAEGEEAGLMLAIPCMCCSFAAWQILFIWLGGVAELVITWSFTLPIFCVFPIMMVTKTRF